MNFLALISTLTIAAFIYGNLSLIIAARIQSAPFDVLFGVAFGWSTLFLVVFITFADRIIGFFSRYKFFKKWLGKIKEMAHRYEKSSVLGTFLATMIPLPPCGIYAGSVVGLSLGFSKLKTFWIVWGTNMIQFAIMYMIIYFFRII
jgi:uncharacterized membrane protein